MMYMMIFLDLFVEKKCFFLKSYNFKNLQMISGHFVYSLDSSFYYSDHVTNLNTLRDVIDRSRIETSLNEPNDPSNANSFRTVYP